MNFHIYDTAPPVCFCMFKTHSDMLFILLYYIASNVSYPSPNHSLSPLCIPEATLAF